MMVEYFFTLSPLVHMQTLIHNNKAWLVTIFSFAALLVFGMVVSMGASAEDASKAATIKLIKEKCATIADREYDCHAGKSQKQCEALPNSYNWFLSEFKVTSEVACSVIWTNPDFLVEGPQTK